MKEGALSNKSKRPRTAGPGPWSYAPKSRSRPSCRAPEPQHDDVIFSRKSVPVQGTSPGQPRVTSGPHLVPKCLPLLGREPVHRAPEIAMDMPVDLGPVLRLHGMAALFQIASASLGIGYAPVDRPA